MGLRRVALALVATTTLSGCPDPGPPAPQPGLLLLTIDRFAQLEGPEAPTPHLDALFREGTVFTDASPATPDLRANVAALLSAQHPATTGCHTLEQPLPAGSWTVAERVYEQDVWTGAVCAVAPMANALGLEQGFEEYDGELYDGPAAVVEASRPWLEERGASPGGFLLWLHLGGETVAPIDAALGELRDLLQDNGLDDRTTIVLVGARTPESSLKTVPLVVRHPDVSPATRPEPVGLVDVGPTILELLVGDPGEEHDGASLVGAVLGLPAEPRPVVVELQQGARRSARLGEWTMSVDGDGAPGLMRGEEPVTSPADVPRATFHALRAALGLEPAPHPDDPPQPPGSPGAGG